MPAGDRTGPMGMGPMTGRAAGACAGFGAPGFVESAPGFGRGRGGNRGGGRGRRNMFHATGMTGWQRAAESVPVGAAVPPYAAPTREQQLEALKGQADTFEGALGELRQRIAELEVVKAEK